MVKKDNSVYLFIGQDSISKNAKLKKLKEEFLAKGILDFNLDIMYARELTLMDLQERLLCLPLKAAKRIVVIKDIQKLRQDIKDFLLGYVKDPQATILLILDVDRQDARDEFIKGIAKYAQIFRFRENFKPNTFTLSRQIDLKKTGYALAVLNQLMKDGERPERVLGGLRYAWERNTVGPLEMRKKLKLLLNCDIDIKTGRLKPAYALEKLVVNLCSLGKPSH